MAETHEIALGMLADEVPAAIEEPVVSLVRQRCNPDPARRESRRHESLHEVAVGGFEVGFAGRDAPGAKEVACRHQIALAPIVEAVDGCAFEGREVERAAGELIRLADAAPDHAAILTSLHAALRRAGDVAAAEAVLVRLDAVKAAEAEGWERANATESRRRRARQAASRGDLEAAVRLWDEVLAGRDAPSTGMALELAADLSELGRALAALRRHGEALTALRRSLALRPFDSATLSAAARAARTTGDDETADRHESRARLTAPDCR